MFRSLGKLTIFKHITFTIKLGYNEQIETGHFVRYNRVNLCSKMTRVARLSISVTKGCLKHENYGFVRFYYF
jgi:hypothetical protein